MRGKTQQAAKSFSNRRTWFCFLTNKSVSESKPAHRLSPASLSQTGRRTFSSFPTNALYSIFSSFNIRVSGSKKTAFLKTPFWPKAFLRIEIVRDANNENKRIGGTSENEIWLSGFKMGLRHALLVGKSGLTSKERFAFDYCFLSRLFWRLAGYRFLFFRGFLPFGFQTR